MAGASETNKSSIEHEHRKTTFDIIPLMPSSSVELLKMNDRKSFKTPVASKNTSKERSHSESSEFADIKERIPSKLSELKQSFSTTMAPTRTIFYSDNKLPTTRVSNGPWVSKN